MPFRFPCKSVTPKFSPLFPSNYLKTHKLALPFSSYSSLLNSCQHLKNLRQIHAFFMVLNGFFQEPIFPASKFISLYSKFNDFSSAVRVFNTLKEEPLDTLTWNVMFKAHVDSGFLSEALILYKKMRATGVGHDSFTFPILNRAVLALKTDVVFGEMLHCVAVKLGFGFDVYFRNTMIEVYAKSGFVCYALKLFDEMSQRDLVSWTSIISGYASEGDVATAFQLFSKMRQDTEPNSVTVIVMLQGCSSCESFVEGRQLHCFVTKYGLLVDGSLQNSILRMYAQMGGVEEVEGIFLEIGGRNVVSWNELINFYSLRGDIGKIAGRFNQMQKESALSSETITSVISAFAKTGNVIECEMLHCFSVKVGPCDNMLLTSLLDFYARCGELRYSVQLFGEIPYRTSVTWNVMMLGFIQNGCFQEATELIWQMQTAGLEPGAEILRSLIDACTQLGALHLGKSIHAYLIRNQFCMPDEDKMHLGTSILNMYIRGGSISSATECFDGMVVKDIVAWTLMIEGYGIHGLGTEALNLFYRMLREDIEPNGVTFLSLLSSCSHSGLISGGCYLFFSMKWLFGIEPNLDHYTCMVDLLGRSGKLKEALSIILKMVVLADSRIWGALLAASRVHGDRKVGEFAAGRLLKLEPDNAGYHTLLSNIQAGSGEWDEVEEVRRVMHQKVMKKEPGWSCIEGKGRSCCFVSGDRSHERREEIYAVLGHLSRKVQEFGYL